MFAGTVKSLGDFEKKLPDEITIPSARSGEELVLAYHQAQRAVEIATEQSIAILGVELFRIPDDGFGVETYRGYSFILTATSEHEFKNVSDISVG